MAIFSKQKRIVFPENNPDIINKLLDDFGFTEENSDVDFKVENGQKSFGMIIAQLVKQATEEKWPSEKLATQLSLDLGLDIEKAIAFANNLKTQIIDQAQEVEIEIEEEESTPSEALIEDDETTTKELSTDLQEITPDPYREFPLE